MRSKLLLSSFLTVLFVLASSCGTSSNCPVCGTTVNGAYAVIDVISVPEHNPTGEPGGPFNSFDISWINTPPGGGGFAGPDNLDYVSDRIGIAVQVIDTTTNLGIFSIAGQNGVSDGGDNASACVPTIPPIVSVLGNWTRFGCRNGNFHIPGFGASGLFGGFTGGQCCAARANQINPLSGPNGEVVTPDGNTLFSGNGSSSIVVFDLTTANPNTIPPTGPTVIAVIPTGLSADFDGQLGNSSPWPGAAPGTLGNTTGIAGCAASANGRAFSDPTCGDLRGDELSYDPKDKILAVINGDPGLPFITFINVAGLVSRPVTDNCLPIQPTTPFGPPLGNALGPINPSTCILGQIYYDGAGGLGSSTTNPGAFGLNPNTPVDTVQGTYPCPDPSNPQVNSGVSGNNGYLVNVPGGGPATVPCHHGPIIDTNLGTFCNQKTPGPTCTGALSPAGLGGHVWDPNTGYFLLTNANSIAGSPIVGNVDVINPLNPDGPVVVNSFPIYDCMATSIIQGPGDNFLVGCADHDGQAFPPNEYVINHTPSGNISCVPPNSGIVAKPPATLPGMTNCVEVFNTGAVDEIWYNPGDNKYYLAGRDMSPPQMGVIDAGTNQFLTNFPVNTNAHSIAVDPKTNHVFMPQQAGAICGTQTSNGCIDVIAEQ